MLVPTNQPFLLSFDYCVNINGGIDDNINEDDDDYFEDIKGDIDKDIDEDAVKERDVASWQLD